MYKLKKFFAAVICVAMTISMCACSGTQPAPAPSQTEEPASVPEGSTFSITYFDMGQGDAALVECDGNFLLVDGGSKADSQKIFSLLKNRNVLTFYYIVATDMADEHIGGLAAALNCAPADITLCPSEVYPTESFSDLVKYADLNSSGVRTPSAGDKYTMGSCEMEIIWTDDSSSVVKITYGETSFLFAGDISYATEKEIIGSGADLSATVLKLANHGSDRASSADFLRAVKPAHAVISSAGTGGCPGREVLGLLELAGTDLYRTDLHGDITCTSDGRTVTFTTEKQPASENLFRPGTGSEAAQEQEKTEPDTAPTQEPSVNIKAEELYDLNLITTLVNNCASVKTVDEFAHTTFVSGYFRLMGKAANVRTSIDAATGQHTYSGWYNGYSFYHNGTRAVQQVYLEDLEGEGTIPGQYDIAACFADPDAVKYTGREGRDYIFRADIYPAPCNITVDCSTLAVKKTDWEGSSEYDTEYIYDQPVEGREILSSWADGTPMKTVNVCFELDEDGKYTSFEKSFFLPADWELEFDSMTRQILVCMDNDYSQPYEYPGDGINYDLYVTDIIF